MSPNLMKNNSTINGSNIHISNIKFLGNQPHQIQEMVQASPLDLNAINRTVIQIKPSNKRFQQDSGMRTIENQSKSIPFIDGDSKRESRAQFKQGLASNSSLGQDRLGVDAMLQDRQNSNEKIQIQDGTFTIKDDEQAENTNTQDPTQSK